MKSVEPRRIVPISVVTIAAFSVLGIFQLIVLTGALEIEASTVKKVAPWFHGTFIRLVGEHPDTRPEWSTAEVAAEEDVEPDASSAMATVAGFNPEDLSVNIDGTGKVNEKPVIEPTKPQETPAAVIPVTVPETKPAEVIDDDEPVG